MKKEKILFIDDNPGYLKELTAKLEPLFDIDIVLSGNCALGKLSNEYSGFVVDIHLPDFSGDQLIYEIKKVSSKSAFFCSITGTNFEDSLLTFSNSYIDDFINKDSSTDEILNRILRCHKNQQEKANHPIGYTYDHFAVNYDTMQVKYDEFGLNLTLIEFKLLATLIRKLPTTSFFPKDDLLQLIWSDTFVEEKVINTHISNLNKKLEKHRSRVKCKRNKGYYIEHI